MARSLPALCPPDRGAVLVLLAWCVYVDDAPRSARLVDGNVGCTHLGMLG